MKPLQVAGHCGDYEECPKYLVTDQDAYVQGRVVTDPEIVAKTKPGNDEAVVVTPLDQLFEAAEIARHAVRGAAEAGSAKPKRLFDTFTHTIFRLETRQTYVVDQEADRVRAFLEGVPLPERSVRTSAWVRHMALSTMEGKEWSRVRIVEYPLTDYTRFELVSFTESAVVGLITQIAERDTDPALAGLTEDFWLFDGDTDHSIAMIMRYDDEGRFLGSEVSADPAVVARCRSDRDLALAYARPLNEFLVKKADILHA